MVERLETVLNEKVEAQKRRDEIEQDLETNRRTNAENTLNGREAQLEHQLLLMSERIMQLENQQQELEGYGLQNHISPPEYALEVPHNSHSV